MSSSSASSSTPQTGAADAGPWDSKTKQKFETKSKSEFYDPCQEAAQRSYKCLYRNGGDKSMCGEYFQAYRDCKQAWTERRKKETGGKFF
ncbi:Mitochondrial copper homeostasis protein [Purpureocillium takamizusanense]|uniref:Mitochondrial copper homeostasis protein n=1 Tax=Purpureocillium takamizusanense TaxID=2060973 RepID=A0A9Q8QBM3_9HYPO|nr:Mitochondrial copper homeostasis protein [Purpureocillium takamizusanense]UNI17078.1 Mitochondrial copper homeostasis protein [Purpureocillium takamizusanense]